MNLAFSVLKATVATLEHYKACIRWDSQMLTWEYKLAYNAVFIFSKRPDKAEGDSTISIDDTWNHH